MRPDPRRTAVRRCDRLGRGDTESYGPAEGEPDLVCEHDVGRIGDGDHDGDAWIAALARKDGATQWKIDRENLHSTMALYQRDLEAFDRGLGTG